MSYVYKDTDRGADGQRLYTVGFYEPSGVWHAESDWDNVEDASRRVNYLNGGHTESHHPLAT